MNVVVSTKRYVADERWRLRLFDCIAAETRRVAAALKEPQFSAQGSWSDDEFRRRVAALDELLVDLYQAEALMGRWGMRAMRDSLTLGPKRLSDGAGEGGGNTGFLALQWYPSLALSYAGGIAAVAAESYESLLALMHARVSTSRGEMRLVEAATTGFGDLRQHFKALPGHERHHVPFSEYLYQKLKLLLRFLPLGNLGRVSVRHPVLSSTDSALEVVEHHAVLACDAVAEPCGPDRSLVHQRWMLLAIRAVRVWRIGVSHVADFTRSRRRCSLIPAPS